MQLILSCPVCGGKDFERMPPIPYGGDNYRCTSCGEIIEPEELAFKGDELDGRANHD